MAALNPTAVSTETVEALFERRVAAVSHSVDDFLTYLLKYLFSLTRQWQDAENLLQDLWRYVLLNFDEDKIHALPLLRRKAYHLFLDHYRRQVRRGEVLAEEVPDVPAQQPDFAPFTEDGEAALRERFWSEYPGITLTEKQKEVLWLHARYGFLDGRCRRRSSGSSRRRGCGNAIRPSANARASRRHGFP
jgi:DNA-directed RNA polymerase specialized sigma24 family protein